ncbi:MAG: magnesium transporter [Ruminococcus sp.]|jgi:magnesium transporter|uniref:Magnesium transporter MgtE n=1 Tax=Ruminococcoides intestinihominis TaxID=3133161 RepID=A0ABV1HRZ3_9FIRM|nr:magnesium transporter [Ruminococcus sp. 1001270H_150608_F2]HJI49543.1 magnesium transporter [Oscillospiraceae bacterium]
MNKVTKPMYSDEVLKIFRSNLPKEELIEKISDYHMGDIADAFEKMTPEERKSLYPVLGVEMVAEIFSYIEDSEEYIKEINSDKVANLISEMDSDDAVDILEKLSDADRKRIVALLDNDAKQDVSMILSYEDDEIGSEMTTNYIVVKKNLTIKEATHQLITQAGENDNINTIYVVDDKDSFYGAIDLKDLIVAREYQSLDELIIKSYPYVKANEKIVDCIEQLKDYAEDSIPVLDDNKHILGVITAHDIVEVVDEELGEDYAKLGGLTAEEDLNETTLQSTKKRLPWLIILLFLGMGVSSVVGMFETVVAVIPIVICFQSLILDMAGNVGTQSLAVTIRVLMDENLKASDKVKLMFKEVRVGFSNGLLLGTMSFIFVGLYIFLFKGNTFGYSFLVSGCVGFSLLASMVISSLVGTLVPMFFSKIKVDPAVASGPLITTINDLVAVVTYYGMVWIFLIDIFKLA